MHAFFSCLPFPFCVCNMWEIVGVGMCSKHFYSYLFSSHWEFMSKIVVGQL